MRKPMDAARHYPDNRRKVRAERAYDEKHRVDTAGLVPLTELSISSPNRGYGVRYQPTNAESFGEVVRELGIDHREFVFVDYGSGKGKALFLAAELPFRRIIGVEFSPELDEVAQRNIASFVSDAQRCHQIETVCADATEYDPPPEKAVLYFYNPFGESVFRRVLGRIQDSLRRYPREVWIVFSGPSVPSRLIESAGFERVLTSADIAIFRAGLGANGEKSGTG